VKADAPQAASAKRGEAVVVLQASERPLHGSAASIQTLEPLAVPGDAGEQPTAEILVQRYPPGSTIGWHRDAPAFGTVIGVSLASACRLRFQRGKGDARRVWEILLEPRSGYVLAGKARTSWQHSIPPTKELRYSITFRTLRATSARA
jgi:alkylated DNA repair dioxygenase AlkB